LLQNLQSLTILCATMLLWLNVSQRRTVFWWTLLFNFVCTYECQQFAATQMSLIILTALGQNCRHGKEQAQIWLLIEGSWRMMVRSQHIVELDTVPHRRWYQIWDTGNFVVIEFPTCSWMYAGRNTWIIMVILWKSDTMDPKIEDDICFINVCLFQHDHYFWYGPCNCSLLKKIVSLYHIVLDTSFGIKFWTCNSYAVSLAIICLCKHRNF